MSYFECYLTRFKCLIFKPAQINANYVLLFKCFF